MNSMTEAPQDSVLRRHWDANRLIPSSNNTSSGTTNHATSGGGFFSWIKSLFS